MKWLYHWRFRRYFQTTINLHTKGSSVRADGFQGILSCSHVNCISGGYIEPVPVHQQNHQPQWYLPHHPVINQRKPNKLRVVMECAAKFQGRSLNGCLYQGPDTTANMTAALLRFRREHVAVAADITETFMQVKLLEVDRDMLRICGGRQIIFLIDPKNFV